MAYKGGNGDLINTVWVNELALAEVEHITYPWRWQLDAYRVGDRWMHSGVGGDGRTAQW